MNNKFLVTFVFTALIGLTPILLVLFIVAKVLQHFGLI